MEQDLSQQVLGRLDNLEQDVGVLKQDVSVLKQDVGVLKQDVGVLKQDVGVLKQDVGVLKQGQDRLTGLVEQLAVMGHDTSRKLSELADNMERQRHILMRMEHDFGQRLNASLDGHNANSESLAGHEGRLIRLEDTTDMLTQDVASLKKTQTAN